MDSIGDCLGIGGRTRSTAIDAVVYVGELVGYTIGLEGTYRVCTNCL
jgi:hypothetical protein